MSLTCPICNQSLDCFEFGLREFWLCRECGVVFSEDDLREHCKLERSVQEW